MTGLYLPIQSLAWVRGAAGWEACTVWLKETKWFVPGIWIYGVHLPLDLTCELLSGYSTTVLGERGLFLQSWRLLFLGREVFGTLELENFFVIMEIKRPVLFAIWIYFAFQILEGFFLLFYFILVWFGFVMLEIEPRSLHNVRQVLSP